MSTTEIIPQWTKLDRLTKSRVEAGLSTKDIATRLQVSERTVRNWENGVTRITHPAVMAWSAFTGVPVWWIEGETPDPTDPTGGFITQR